jgi:hypothetical protein
MVIRDQNEGLAGILMVQFDMLFQGPKIMAQVDFRRGLDTRDDTGGINDGVFFLGRGHGLHYRFRFVIYQCVKKIRIDSNCRHCEECPAHSGAITTWQPQSKYDFSQAVSCGEPSALF